MMIAPLVMAFVTSATLGELFRRLALRRMLVDIPNERSLHQNPVPRVGGLGLVLGALAGLLWAWPAGEVRTLVLLSGGVVALGAVDDFRPLSPALRFGVQGVLAACLVFAHGPAVLPVVKVGASALTVVLLVGMLNIYNFMDGMDGLAGCQALFTGAAQAAVFASAGCGDLAAVAACLGAASLGFLVHNFPPARMFMGDAGATTLGFAFAALATAGSHRDVPLTRSLLPLAPFLLDGVFTILRRALRGERVWRAHRSHLYQRAVQAGLTHRQVLGVYVLWMVCCAGAAVLGLGAVSGLGVALVGLAGTWVWIRWLETRSQVSTRA